MLLQPLMKKLEVLVMINQWATYCINDNNDERWMIVLIDVYLTFLYKLIKVIWLNVNIYFLIMLLILSDWKYWKCENNKLTLIKTSTFKNANFAKFKMKKCIH